MTKVRRFLLFSKKSRAYLSEIAKRKERIMSLVFDEQWSALQKPNREEIPDELFEVFEKAADTQMENWGFVNSLLKIMPLNPYQHMGFIHLKAGLFDEDKSYLPTVWKEMMGLVISSTNGCAFCCASHSDYLRGYTGDPVWVDQLIHNYREAKLNDKQRALCDYAYFITTRPKEFDEEQLEKLRAVGFNDHEIMAAAFVAGFFNYTNRWANTCMAMPNPAHYSHNR